MRILVKDHTESFVPTGTRGQWISRAEQWLIYKQTWSNERDTAVKTEKQKRQELIRQFYTILGVIWLQSRLNQPITLLTAGNNEPPADDVGLTLREYLLEIRDGWSFDISRNPEGAYQLNERNRRSKHLFKLFFSVCLFFFGVAAVIGLYRNYNAGEAANIWDLVQIGCLTVCIISGITLLFNFNGQVKVSEATGFIAKMWSMVRRHYDEVGFVNAVVEQLLQDKVLASRILRSETLSDQLATGTLLRNMFKKYYVKIGVPFVRSQESFNSQDVESARRAKGRFDLMDLLTPYMGFSEHPGSLRQYAYNTARRMVQQEHESETESADGEGATTKIIRFPKEDEGKGPRRPTPRGGPTPPGGTPPPMAA